MIRPFQKTFLALILATYGSYAQAQVAAMPFDFNGKQIFIGLTANNGQKLRFLFDTGSTGALIDSTSAKRADLYNGSKQEVFVDGSGGSKSYQLVSDREVSLQNVKLKKLSFVLAGFQSLSEMINEPFDGIIGYEILEKYVTNLNFDDHSLKLYNDLKDVDTTGYISIPFEFSKNILIPRIPISVTLANNEQFAGKVMFDTGNASTMLVSTPFYKYHDFERKLGTTKITAGSGLHAETTELVANITAMDISQFKFDKMAIRLTVNPEAEAKDGYLGILGIEVIKRFNLILDYANKKIYLKPNKLIKEPFPVEALNADLSNQSRKFMSDNKRKAGIKTTKSGMQYQVIKQGSGIIPTMKDRVVLHFNAKLIDGQPLWNTYQSGKPWIHHLDKAILGVREAVLMMPAGSKWKLFIPPALAYGDTGYDNIPGGAALIYELEVLNALK